MEKSFSTERVENSWIFNAPGTGCEECFDPRHPQNDIPSFPLEEGIEAVTFRDEDDDPYILGCTKSGWSFGDEKAEVAICPAHANFKNIEVIRKHFGLNRSFGNWAKPV